MSENVSVSNGSNFFYFVWCWLTITKVVVLMIISGWFSKYIRMQRNCSLWIHRPRPTMFYKSLAFRSQSKVFVDCVSESSRRVSCIPKFPTIQARQLGFCKGVETFPSTPVGSLHFGFLECHCQGGSVVGYSDWLVIKGSRCKSRFCFL